MKSQCTLKISFKNCEQQLFWPVCGECAEGICATEQEDSQRAVLFLMNVQHFQLMFVSNTALTLTLLLWLYDMGMFPKLHGVGQ